MGEMITFPSEGETATGYRAIPAPDTRPAGAGWW